MANSMGELRSLLQRFKQENWQELIQLLKTWPTDEGLFEVALPYCHDMLKTSQSPRPANEELTQIIYGRIQDDSVPHRLLAIASLCTEMDDSAQMRPYSEHYHAITQIKLPPVQPLFHLTKFLLYIRNENSPCLNYLAQHKMPNLSTLKIGFSSYASPDVAQALQGATWLGQNLQTLRIYNGKKTLSGLLKLTDLSHLHTLDISNNNGRVSTENLQELLDQTTAQHLRILDCSDAWMREEAAPIIANHKSLSQLERFEIFYNMDFGERINEVLASTTLSDAAKSCINAQYDDIFE